MQKKTEISWTRILAEAGAIVVSILLAFGIDAWWQARQSEDDVRPVLSSLASELATLKHSDGQNIQYVSAIRQSARQILDAVENDAESVTREEFDRLLADQLWIINPTEQNYPELNSLMNSGNIALIPSAAIRQQLGTLKSELTAYNVIFQFNQDFYFDQLMPYFDKHTDLLQISFYDDGQPGVTMRPAEYEKISLTSSTDHSYLLEDREFKNLMMRRIWLIDDIFVFRPKDLDQRIDAATALIEGHLSK